MLKHLCVYCGSSDDIPAEYVDIARAMGRAIAERGMTLVYGAGGTGLMGALADEVLAAGNQVIGVTIKRFDNSVLTHSGLSELHVLDTMHERKEKMVQLSDGFIALPGGFGTLDEFIEVLAWAQIGLHQQPVGLLNYAGYYDHLLAMVEHARAQGFLYDRDGELLISDSDPGRLLERLGTYEPPEGLERWLER